MEIDSRHEACCEVVQHPSCRTSPDDTPDKHLSPIEKLRRSPEVSNDELMQLIQRALQNRIQAKDGDQPDQ